MPGGRTFCRPTTFCVAPAASASTAGIAGLPKATRPPRGLPKGTGRLPCPPPEFPAAAEACSADPTSNFCAALCCVNFVCITQQL